MAQLYVQRPAVGHFQRVHNSIPCKVHFQRPAINRQQLNSFSTCRPPAGLQGPAPRIRSQQPFQEKHVCHASNSASPGLWTPPAYTLRSNKRHLPNVTPGRVTKCCRQRQSVACRYVTVVLLGVAFRWLVWHKHLVQYVSCLMETIVFNNGKCCQCLIWPLADVSLTCACLPLPSYNKQLFSVFPFPLTTTNIQVGRIVHNQLIVFRSSVCSGTCI